MRLFRLWTRDQCVSAITKLEQGIATGAASVSYPTAAGSVSFVSLDSASRILEHLYARLDQIDGKKRKGLGIGIVRVVPRRGL